MKRINQVITTLLLVLVMTHSAFAQLSVSPKRVIFENRERSHELLLINTGDKTKKYRIHFKQLKMTTHGGYEDITEQEAGQYLYASDAVRFSPRQVTLKPGMTQTIRLLVRKPKGLADGEYRSHLTFSEIPDDSEDFGTPQAEQTEGMAFEMRPLLGMSIPIILRQGKLTQSVEIKNIQVDASEVNVELHRVGQASVYGQMDVMFKPANGSSLLEVGKIKGVSVLTPLDWRTVVIPLNTDISQLGAGSLELIYHNLEENSAQDLPVLTKTTIDI